MPLFSIVDWRRSDASSGAGDWRSNLCLESDRGPQVPVQLLVCLPVAGLAAVSADGTDFRSQPALELSCWYELTDNVSSSSHIVDEQPDEGLDFKPLEESDEEVALEDSKLTHKTKSYS